MLPPDLVAKLNECAANADFVSAREVWFFRQTVFSWLVIGGLVCEGPELMYEMLSIIRSNIQFFRYRIVLLERRVELAKVVAFVGWILIIGGLFGELRSGSRIADFSARIEGCSDAKLQKATEEAEDTSVHTAELEKEAAQLRLQLADRHITFAQRQKMLSILKPRSGASASIEFLTPSGTDAPEFSEEIREIFRDAGWKVPKPTGVLVTMDSPVRGFVIQGGKTRPELRAARKALQVLDNRVLYELTRVGVEAPPAAVMIYVGSK